MKSALVIPFPLAAQTRLVARAASFAAGMKPEEADRYLTRQRKLQRQALAHKRVPPRLIERECDSFADAVRLIIERMRQHDQQHSGGSAA